MCFKKKFDPLKNGYELVFNDVDFFTWANQESWGNVKNNVIWLPECVTAGRLKADINPDPNEPPNRCGMIASWNLYTQRYGYFEASVKVAPQGKKFWSAFWLYDPNKWENGEIDILECMGNTSAEATFTLHDWHDGKHNVRSGNKLFWKDLSNDFHLYAVEWTKDVITWYVDGYKVFQVFGDIPSVPMQLILNISSENTEYIFKPEDVPQYMEIESVRVYQKKQV